MKRNSKVAIIGVIILVLFCSICLFIPRETETIPVLPQNPHYLTHDEVTIITYKEPYTAFVQYFPSDVKIITDTEHLLVSLTDGWDDENIDFDLARGMDSVGKEHLAVARVVNNKYEIRAYQDIGLENFAYVSASCAVTDYSLEDLYAGIENTIRSYEKENREIKLS